MHQQDTSRLNIVHCFRSPVGGIFRHVRDLVDQQHRQGHRVGILCDSLDGGEYEDQMFEALMPKLSLGLKRIPMRRSISPMDIPALLKAHKEIKPMTPDVIHSHSAKGGVFGRSTGFMLSRGKKKTVTLYCPHGGAMHYDSASLKGKVFFFAERFLERFTDRLIFVSKYERDADHEKVGNPQCEEALIYNGLSSFEFEPVLPSKDAADFLYIGMMRDLKGPDVFLDAMRILNSSAEKKFTAHFVGDGPDKETYVKTIKKYGLENQITVHDAMPARNAFAMAKLVVVPSRAESMPYLVLEALAAAKPLVATNVGGIPEIFEGSDHQLIEPGNANELATGMLNAIENPDSQKIASGFSHELQKRFTVEVMGRHIEKAYHDCL